MLAYPFFQQTTAVVGQLSRYGEPFSANQIRARLITNLGQLGSLHEAVTRIVYSLRDWGILQPAEKRNDYSAPRRMIGTHRVEVEAWLLACALHLQPVNEIPFVDLVNLPELFPFQLAVTIGTLRDSPHFEIQRQGMNLNMVRLA